MPYPERRAMEEKLVWCRCGCLLAAKRQKMQLTVNTSLFANYKCATKLLSVAFESGLRLTVAFAGSSTETTGGYVTVGDGARIFFLAKIFLICYVQNNFYSFKYMTFKY